MSTAEVYRRASEMLTTSGWYQGRNYGPAGEMCLGAAVNIAGGRHVAMDSEDLFRPLARWLVANQPTQLRIALASFMREAEMNRVMTPLFERGEARRSVLLWNDWGRGWRVNDPRTKDEVLAVLDAAASELESGTDL
jgi:hypothetical protein